MVADNGRIGPDIWDCDPDMGFFLGTHHPREQNTGINIYADSARDPIEVCFKVAGGDSSLPQQCQIRLSQTWLPVPSGEPAYTLDNWERSWKTFGRRPGSVVYWFFGYHMIDGAWQVDGGVGHVTEEYSRGRLTTVYFDDLGTGGANDFVLQVFVPRRRVRIVVPAGAQAAANKRFKTSVLPGLKARLTET